MNNHQSSRHARPLDGLASCRSSASSARLHLPECATAPEEVYELAKRRGMDFVTITDHDTIAGALTIADRADTFISEELTVSFKRRAPGRARPLLRDHPRRPRVAASPQRRRRDLRRLPAASTRSPPRSRTRSTPSARR